MNRINLNDYIDSVAHKAFKLGEHDCVQFVRGFILASKDIDILNGEEYSNWRDIRRLSRKYDGRWFRSIEHHLTGMGFQKKDCHNHGDIVFTYNNLNQRMLSISAGNGICATAGREGIAILKPERIEVIYGSGS